MSATYTEGERPEPASVDELIPVTSGITSGDDKIKRSVNNILIQALGGNDSIVYTGSNSSISGDFVTIDGGLSNNYIDNEGYSVKIFGDDGNDQIITAQLSTDVSISGRRGNDSIVNGGANVLFVYNESDDIDTIYGFKEYSTLQIGDGTGTCSTQVEGSDSVVIAGDGAIILKDAASLLKLNINVPAGENSTIDGGTDDDFIENSEEKSLLLGDDGNGDMPVNDLMRDDNFTGAELGDIMTTSTNDALTGEIFTDDPTVIAPLQATFASSTDK